MATCQIEQVAARETVSSLHIKPLIQVQLFPPSNTINTEVMIETNKCLTMEVTACGALRKYKHKGFSYTTMSIEYL